MRSALRRLELIAYCRKHGRITSADAATLFGVRPSCARFVLHQATLSGVLVKRPRGGWELGAGIVACGISARILDLASRRLLVSVTTLSRELGEPRKRLWEALTRLRKHGQMERVRYGVWRRCA